jgi:hypothetical protein
VIQSVIHSLLHPFFIRLFIQSSVNLTQRRVPLVLTSQSRPSESTGCVRRRRHSTTGLRPHAPRHAPRLQRQQREGARCETHAGRRSRTVHAVPHKSIACTHSHAHSLTHSVSLTHSLTHSLHPPTHSHSHSLTHPLPHSLPHSLTHSLTHSNQPSSRPTCVLSFGLASMMYTRRRLSDSGSRRRRKKWRTSI